MLRSAMEGGKAIMEFVFDQGFTLEESTNRDEIYAISNFAVRCKDPEVLEFFLNKGICTKKTLHPFGNDLLSELVDTRSNLEAAKAKIDLLLAYGIDIEARGRWSGPCLHLATINGSDDMVSLLPERGANPLSEHETVRVMSPLSLAVEWGNFTKTKYLLEAIEKRGIPL